MYTYNCRRHLSPPVGKCTCYLNIRRLSPTQQNIWSAHIKKNTLDLILFRHIYSIFRNTDSKLKICVSIFGKTTAKIFEWCHSWPFHHNFYGLKLYKLCFILKRLWYKKYDKLKKYVIIICYNFSLTTNSPHLHEEKKITKTEIVKL